MFKMVAQWPGSVEKEYLTLRDALEAARRIVDDNWGATAQVSGPGISATLFEVHEEEAS